MNIETMRMLSDTTGWKGGAATSFSFQKNKTEVLSIGANAHFQYKGIKNLYLFIADYNLLKSDDKQLSDNMYYHIRYNRKMGKTVRWEVFTQLQRNAITNISVRMLAGTGPRFKVHESKKFRLYLATAGMYEYEEELNESKQIHRDIRNSSYVSFTWSPNANFSIITTTYYQPLFKYIGDYRVFNQLSLVLKATKHFAITTDWSYLFDNYPAAGAPRYNYAVSNGFSYRF